jgi:hypothetical protein
MKTLAMSTALLCGLFLCGCTSQTKQPAESAGSASTGTPSPSTGTATSAASRPWTGTDIDQFLAKKPNSSHASPLAGQGAAFVTSGQRYSVDPRLIVAITAAETSYATGKCHSTPVVNTHNAWNWFWCEASHGCGNDVCVSSPFDTWGSGIETVSHFMRSTYINKGYYDVKLIASKYCTVGCENWIPNVTASMREMNGDPENLSLDTGH